MPSHRFLRLLLQKLNHLVGCKEVKFTFILRFQLRYEEELRRLVLPPLLPFTLGVLQRDSRSAFCPATETFHRPPPWITVGTNISAEFQHQLFPDLQNSFLESQAGCEENTGVLGELGKAYVRLFKLIMKLKLFIMNTGEQLLRRRN